MPLAATIRYIVRSDARYVPSSSRVALTRGSAGRTGIGGQTTAGPVCPVEKNPPDPACAPRPVAGAVLLVRDASGAQVAQTTTAANGTFFIDLPPGGYVVEPQPVSGLMGTAGSQSVTVNQGVASTIQIDYATGIR